MKPYLDAGVFYELRDPEYFKKVKVFFGGIAWPNEQDISSETIEFGMAQEISSE